MNQSHSQKTDSDGKWDFPCGNNLVSKRLYQNVVDSYNSGKTNILQLISNFCSADDSEAITEEIMGYIDEIMWSSGVVVKYWHRASEQASEKVKSLKDALDAALSSTIAHNFPSPGSTPFSNNIEPEKKINNNTNNMAVQQNHKPLSRSTVVKSKTEIENNKPVSEQFNEEQTHNTFINELGKQYNYNPEFAHDAEMEELEADYYVDSIRQNKNIKKIEEETNKTTTEKMQQKTEQINQKTQNINENEDDKINTSKVNNISINKNIKNEKDNESICDNSNEVSDNCIFINEENIEKVIQNQNNIDTLQEKKSIEAAIAKVDPLLINTVDKEFVEKQLLNTEKEAITNTKNNDIQITEEKKLNDHEKSLIENQQLSIFHPEVIPESMLNPSILTKDGIEDQKKENTSTTTVNIMDIDNESIMNSIANADKTMSQTVIEINNNNKEKISKNDVETTNQESETLKNFNSLIGHLNELQPKLVFSTDNTNSEKVKSPSKVVKKGGSSTFLTTESINGTLLFQNRVFGSCDKENTQSDDNKSNNTNEEKDFELSEKIIKPETTYTQSKVYDTENQKTKNITINVYNELLPPSCLVNESVNQPHETKECHQDTISLFNKISEKNKERQETIETDFSIQEQQNINNNKLELDELKPPKEQQPNTTLTKSESEKNLPNYMFISANNDDDPDDCLTKNDHDGHTSKPHNFEIPISFIRNQQMRMEMAKIKARFATDSARREKEEKELQKKERFYQLAQERCGNGNMTSSMYTQNQRIISSYGQGKQVQSNYPQRTKSASVVGSKTKMMPGINQSNIFIENSPNNNKMQNNECIQKIAINKGHSNNLTNSQLSTSALHTSTNSSMVVSSSACSNGSNITSSKITQNFYIPPFNFDNISHIQACLDNTLLSGIPNEKKRMECTHKLNESRRILSRETIQKLTILQQRAKDGYKLTITKLEDGTEKCSYTQTDQEAVQELTNIQQTIATSNHILVVMRDNERQSYHSMVKIDPCNGILLKIDGPDKMPDEIPQTLINKMMKYDSGSKRFVSMAQTMMSTKISAVILNTKRPKGTISSSMY